MAIPYALFPLPYKAGDEICPDPVLNTYLRDRDPVSLPSFPNDENGKLATTLCHFYYASTFNKAGDEICPDPVLYIYLRDRDPVSLPSFPNDENGKLATTLCHFYYASVLIERETRFELATLTLAR
jgi:hypothetical protein